MYQTNGINGSQNVGRQSCIPSLDIFFQLRNRGDAHDGAGHRPAFVAKSQRHLGGRQTIVPRKLVVELGSN